MRTTPARPAVPLTTASPEELLSGDVPRVWTSPLYLAGLVAVALAMVLLPLLYLALIGLLVFGLYQHATYSLPMVRGTAGLRWRVALFIAPLIIGLVLLFFMIKPLFARRARGERRISLVPDNDPVLFAFIGRLCGALGAPRPRRIDVDCLINASASFRHGALSLFWPGDLVLTIGAPLVAGLTLRQFAGVVAHEFGHFTQGLGMRLSYVIRQVNAWFARVVYQRDAWDEKLIALSQSDDSRWNIVFLVARFFVWLTRRILWALMTAGHVISSAMMRQMEYNADRYEIGLAGSEHFESTMLRLVQLNLASQALHGELAAAWREGRLADDLPALIADRVESIPPHVTARIRADLESRKTGVFDTHPADGARIRQARKLAKPGIIAADAPASSLFKDFEGLCKTTTLFYYQDLIGPSFNPANLISAKALTRRTEQHREQDAAAERYFVGCISAMRPLNVDAHSPVAQLRAGDCLAKLKHACSVIEKARPVIDSAVERHRKAEVAVARARLAQTLIKARVSFVPKDFELSAASPDQAYEARNRAEGVLEDASAELAKCEAVLQRRVECALSLLNAPQVAERLTDAARARSRCKKILEALSTFRGITHDLAELWRSQPSLRTLHEAFDPNKRDEALLSAAWTLMQEQHQRLTEIRHVLSEAAYPYQHAHGEVTIGRYAIPELPGRDDWGGIGMAADRVLDHLGSLYGRLMGELACIAEQVERAVGLAATPKANAGHAGPAPRAAAQPRAAKQKEA